MQQADLAFQFLIRILLVFGSSYAGTVLAMAIYHGAGFFERLHIYTNPLLLAATIFMGLRSTLVVITLIVIWITTSLIYVFVLKIPWWFCAVVATEFGCATVATHLAFRS